MLNEKPVSLWNAVAAIVFCVLVAFIMLNFGFLGTVFSVDVSGESMEDTLKNGDKLYADRMAVPERGDIIIIDVSEDFPDFHFSGENIIKRLIAVEGDTVRITGGKVYRRLAGTEEFVPLEEDYTKGATYADGSPFEITVGEDEFFFLGDHRTNSTDSRVLGCCKRKDVVGVITDWSFTAKPMTRWGAFFEWVKDLI